MDPSESLITAPAAAMSMTYVVMANSIGLAMQNASANQQRGHLISQAALAEVLGMILAASKV
jgi:hypothetical protein